MTWSRQRALLAAIAAASVSVAAPAAGFELFGVRLWGAPEADDANGIIDPVRYSVDFAVSPAGDADAAADLDRALRGASNLWRDRDEPVSGQAGLLSRARGDYRRILATLYNNAYYGGEISILLAGIEAADVTLGGAFPAVVPVTIRVRPGPRFRFGEAVIVNPPPAVVGEQDAEEEAAAAAFRTGAQADAGVIAAASATAIRRWRAVSYAKAREVDRSAIADHPTSLLDARITLDPDRAARFGAVRVSGTRRVDPGFIAYMAGIPEGSSFDPDRVRIAEERLSRLGVFQSVRVVEADRIAPDGTLDMSIMVEDRRPRTIGFGGTVSTLDGLGLEAYWQHRNLFGRAEQLRFDASVTGLGLSGSAGDSDYSAGVSFLRPGVFRPYIDFIASLSAQRLDLDNYREQSVTGRVGLQRNFARNLNGELSFAVTKARFEDFYGTRDFLMFIPTARGTFDRRDDTLDPTRGYYLAAEILPFYESDFGNFGFRGTLEGRIYRGFGAERKFVLAARGRIGVYDGPPDAESPPNQLFFAGGAGSIRGYAYRSIGIDVTDADGETGVVGGRGLVEGSGEVRYRINERFGAVGFIDAGFVAATGTFADGGGDVRAGAGAGVRYYTGLGPIRVDLAAPLNPRSEDSAVALYIGIGQSF